MQKQAIRFDDTAVAFASKTDKNLRKSHFVFSTTKLPFIVNLGVKVMTWALNIGLPVKGLIKNTIFNQFCGGESITDSTNTITHLAKFKVKTILDYSVEGESNEVGFDDTCKEIVEICRASKDDPNVPFCVVKLTGIGSSGLMEKVQNGEKISEIEKNKLAFMQDRAEEIAKAAKSNGLLFMIDAEESWIQDVIDEVAIELMLKFNKDYPHVYNTYQLYRKNTLSKLKQDAVNAEKSGIHFGVKIVRGAYMEKERERAEEMNFTDPIQKDKISTDHDYDQALKYCLENLENIGLCAGTHNEGSSEFLTELMEDNEIEKNDPRVYFAQLLGMSDHITFNLANAGYNVAKYVPYGPVDKVMPYLFRRAKENTSMTGQSDRELRLVKKEIQRRRRKN